MLRLLFLGTPDFAVPSLARLLQSEHRVVGVVSQPDRPRGRGQHVQPPPVKVLAQAHDLLVWQPLRLKDPDLIDALRAVKPDAAVVAAYGRIIPDVLLDLPRLGMINVHASLLPRWRGASPIQRAVMAGDRETGITIMRVVSELDAGPMLAKATRPIGPDETAADVERDLAEIGAALLPPVLGALESGTTREEPQDVALVTFAPRLEKGDGAVDWTLTAPELHNRVRGLHPWPLAFSWLGAARITILRTRAEAARHTVTEGTIVEARGDRIVVAAGAGTSLALLEVRPEGRRAMTAREFLSGHRVEPGARFLVHPPA